MSSADELWSAWQDGRLLAGLADPPADVAAGMAVQAEVGRLAGPGYGWKIAATSPTGLAFLGIDAPLAGRLYERFRHDDGDTVPADTLHMGVAEAEFAFVMAADPGPDPALADVLAAVGTMRLAIELPTSRFERFAGVGAPALAADAACAGRLVLGPEVPDWPAVDLVTQPVVCRAGGEEQAGSGALVLGDPRLALHWLAAELPRFGLRLGPGDVVATGTATKPVPVAPGAEVVADFAGLGSVRATLAT